MVYSRCMRHVYQCNRFQCPLARLYDLQYYNVSHNGHGIILYGVLIILMGNYLAEGHFDWGLSVLVHRTTGTPHNYVFDAYITLYVRVTVTRYINMDM